MNFQATDAPRDDQFGSGQSVEDDGVDLRRHLQLLWRGKWIVAAFAGLALCFAVLYLANQTPLYKAEARVLYAPSQTNVVDLDAVVANPLQNKEVIVNQIEILGSADLIRKVIVEERLNQSPVFNPALAEKTESLIGALLGLVDLRGMLAAVGILPPPPQVSFDEQLRRDAQTVFTRVKDGLSIKVVRNSHVLRIGFTSTNPHLSARISNAFARVYIREQLSLKLGATREATLFLAERVEELKTRVEEAEGEIEAYRARIAAQTGQTADSVRAQLGAMNQRLVEAQTARSAAETRFQQVSAQLSSAREDFGFLADLVRSQAISSYREREQQLRQREAQLARSVSDSHPSLQEVRARIADVRADMRTEATRIATALESEYELARATEIEIERTAAALEDRLLRLSGEGVELRQLEREAQASRIIYENFLSRLKETSEQERIQEADAQIIDRAEAPTEPISAGRMRILGLAGVLGAMLGVGIIFLRESLNDTFRTVDQLEDMAKLDVIGMVPALPGGKDRNTPVRYITEKPQSSLAEAVRALRTSILFSNVDHPPKTVMFTSSVPGEGKSTTSVLLALLTVNMGKSAIIVECDLRLPTISKIVQMEDRPGLVGVLNETATFNEAVYVDPITGLHVLPAASAKGSFKINAADILSSNRFAQLIRELRKHYDMIVLDTPPTLSVSDARIVANVADTVMYAVKWDGTPRNAVLSGLREIKAANHDNVHLVATLVDEKRAQGYGYSDYTYYRMSGEKYYTN